MGSYDHFEQIFKTVDFLGQIIREHFDCGKVHLAKANPFVIIRFALNFQQVFHSIFVYSAATTPAAAAVCAAAGGGDGDDSVATLLPVVALCLGRLFYLLFCFPLSFRSR